MTAASVVGAGTPLIDQAQHTPILVLGVLLCCLGTAFLALWRAARDYRVFRVLGLFYLVVGVQELLRYSGNEVVFLSLRAISVGILVVAAGDAMQVPRRRWTWLFWPIYLFVAIAVWFPSLEFTADWPMLVSEIPLGILIVLGFTRGNSRDRMIAAAFFFYLLVRLTLSNSIQRLTGMKTYAALGYTTGTLTALGAVTLAILVRDLIRDRSEKQRLAAELAASRAVQQLLIPEEIPTVPGFRIQAVYKPFGEVGGDFFQIIPLSGAGVLIAIGDVSGKGMPAAMLVSLLVGALHALAKTTASPAQLLAGLNQSVQGRSRGGFTTCLILHIQADGAMTFANAGHISPYRNGMELSSENGLPLGLVAERDYSEFTLQLGLGDQLTLLTDGVLEARNAKGELLGFERMTPLTTKSAEEIADAAQSFGQEDDITVLTVARSAAVA
jgi:Stage II sporulation protein E (SpoIIE)